MGHSELRVGMNTSAYGNVEIRTAVAENRVVASVVAAHAELRAAMAAEMPSLQHAMEQHQLRLDRFDLNSHSGGQDHRGSAEQQPGGDAGLRWESSQLRVDRPAASEETPSISPWNASSGINVHA